MMRLKFLDELAPRKLDVLTHPSLPYRGIMIVDETGLNVPARLCVAWILPHRTTRVVTLDDQSGRMGRLSPAAGR